MSASHQSAVIAPEARWRTRDITVAAAIGVAFGVAFIAVGPLWKAVEFLGPAQNIFYGVWLLPAIVAPLIIRKPGAALFAEMVAASVSLIGSQWGPDTLLSGFVQGAAAEIVFALTLYRTWSWPVLAAAALASSAAAFVHDWALYYATYDAGLLTGIAVAMAASGILLLPAAAVAIVRALRRAGVLEGFPA